MQPAPPLSPFLRPQRFSPPRWLGDVAISRADSGVRVVSPLPHCCVFGSPTRGHPSECSPLCQLPLPHPSPKHAGVRFTVSVSPLAVGPLPPPLHSPFVLQRVVCFPQPQGFSLTESPLCPSPERRSTRYSRGLLICMGGKVVRMFCFILRGERAFIRASASFQVRVHPTSRSTAACILQHSAWCSHTGPRPPHQMRSDAGPLSPLRPSSEESGWCACRAWGFRLAAPSFPEGLVGVASVSPPRVPLRAALAGAGGVSRSGFVLLSFSAVFCSAPRGKRRLPAASEDAGTVCGVCPPSASRLRVASGVECRASPEGASLAPPCPGRPGSAHPLHDRLADTDGFVTSKNI